MTLEGLVALKPTIERVSLYGSACKRLGMPEAGTRNGNEEKKALENIENKGAAKLAREIRAPKELPVLLRRFAGAQLEGFRTPWPICW